MKAKAAKSGDDVATANILQKLAQQLVIFSKSEDENDEFSMWSFLADVLVNHNCKQLINSKKQNNSTKKKFFIKKQNFSSKNKIFHQKKNFYHL